MFIELANAFVLSITYLYASVMSPLEREREIGY